MSSLTSLPSDPEECEVQEEGSSCGMEDTSIPEHDPSRAGRSRQGRACRTSSTSQCLRSAPHPNTSPELGGLEGSSGSTFRTCSHGCGVVKIWPSLGLGLCLLRCSLSRVSPPSPGMQSTVRRGENLRRRLHFAQIFPVNRDPSV